MKKINERLEEMTLNILISNDMLKIPVDVIKIANSNDISVYEGELDKKVSGAIRYDKSNNKFEILVNKNDEKVRQRFTIAHELGHYFLHKEYFKNKEMHIDVMYKIKDNEEQEVDYFAGALLVNKTILEKLYGKNTIAELAELFDVSVSAMTVRLDILGML